MSVEELDDYQTTLNNFWQQADKEEIDQLIAWQKKLYSRIKSIDEQFTIGYLNNVDLNDLKENNPVKYEEIKEIRALIREIQYISVIKNLEYIRDYANKTKPNISKLIENLQATDSLTQAINFLNGGDIIEFSLKNHLDSLVGFVREKLELSESKLAELQINISNFSL